MPGYGFFAVLTIIALLIGPAVPAAAQQAPDCDSVAACGSLAPAAAGPALLQWLQHENWDTRVEAAFALGGIGYQPSVPELIKALSNDSDWQFVYAAIVSLGRLQDPSALQPLREAAAAYWYPPVRAAAECAAQWIESGKMCAHHAQVLDMDWSGLRKITIEAGNCDKRPYSKMSETDAIKQYGNEEALQEFKYTGDECTWFGDADPETGARPCLARRILYPQMAARTADGWLTGRDQAGSGGELMFFPDAGKPYRVLEENVEDIYVLEEGAVALTGLADATVNRGMVYSLRKDAAGKWQGEPLLRMPGAPESSYKISKTGIFVNAYGTLIVFDEQGNPKMAACRKKK